jgi:hypothetical protein
MGEAKRKKVAGTPREEDKRILPAIPITVKQSEKFVQMTTTGSWIGIGALVGGWLVFRWLGPALGWWHLSA